MIVGISGFEKSGKTTLFSALTGIGLEISCGQTPENHINEGVVPVYDERIKILSDIFKPRKTTYATIEYLDLPGISPKDNQRNQKILNNLKEIDLIIHVIRAFEDPVTVHPFGEINIKRDIRAFESELILTDLVLIEKRIERIEANLKRGLKERQEELILFKSMYEHLNNDKPLRTYSFSDEDRKILLPYKFVSAKPIIHLVNLSEGQCDPIDDFREFQGEKDMAFISLCARLEMEISQISEEERKEFLSELNIEEPASYRLTREAYRLLGLISYFTVGEDEVRAWTIRRGATAKEAGGKIHSDIEKGFIRAEVTAYEDFIKIGDFKKVKEQGLLRLEGKDYIVKDGDIMNFRFNV